MESVQSHLGGWLAKTVSCYGAYHLTWVDQAGFESCFNFTDQPIESILGHSLLLDDSL